MQVYRQMPSRLWAWHAGPLSSPVRQQPDSPQGDPLQTPATWIHPSQSTTTESLVNQFTHLPHMHIISLSGRSQTSDPHHHHLDHKVCFLTRPWSWLYLSHKTHNLNTSGQIPLPYCTSCLFNSYILCSYNTHSKSTPTWHSLQKLWHSVTSFPSSTTKA